MHPSRIVARAAFSPWQVFARLARHKRLLVQFARREVERRYKGAVLGIFWSLLTPMLMLGVYWVVFGLILGGSYGHPGETKAEFVLALFCSLLLWDLVASSTNGAPGLMLASPNLVTKVVFPLEIIPVASVGSALVHLAIGFIPLLLLELVLLGHIPLSALSLPFVVLPIAFYVVGITYTLSALGVFLRDLSSLMPPLVTAAMFMSALFFPISSVPIQVRCLVAANPIALLLEQGRNALVFGQPANPVFLLTQTVFALIALALGHALFCKLKPAFADVL
jgi:lipopolysaccharide transport system permease protein